MASADRRCENPSFPPDRIENICRPAFTAARQASNLYTIRFVALHGHPRAPERGQVLRDLGTWPRLPDRLLRGRPSPIVRTTDEAHEDYEDPRGMPPPRRPATEIAMPYAVLVSEGRTRRGCQLPSSSQNAIT